KALLPRMNAGASTENQRRWRPVLEDQIVRRCADYAVVVWQVRSIVLRFGVGHRQYCAPRRAGICYLAASLRTTWPPFITNFTCSSSLMSDSGSPFTAMMSANFPGSMAPILSDQPIRSAALIVAEWIASSGDM